MATFASVLRRVVRCRRVDGPLTSGKAENLNQNCIHLLSKNVFTVCYSSQKQYECTQTRRQHLKVGNQCCAEQRIMSGNVPDQIIRTRRSMSNCCATLCKFKRTTLTTLTYSPRPLFTCHTSPTPHYFLLSLS